MSKILYRYEIDYKNYDDDTSVRLREIPVVRETNRTYFVRRNGSSIDYRRISKDGDDYGFNAYAYSTKENAKANFIRRTGKRISWYKFWLSECEKALKLIEEES